MKDIRTNIQSLYLRNPVLFILLVSMLLTLPWIGIGDFYTKGEPREASLAVSMLQHGDWVLPIGYADEIGFKPPMMHWLVAGFSLISGHVTEATSRLPSALGLIGMTVFTLIFLLRRKSKVEAIFASLILLTGFEMHRSGLECRVDMTLAFFMSLALMEMYRWEERQLKGFPILLVLLLASASLVKGPVGIVLPCFVFGIYLLLRNYSFWKALGKNALVAVPALLILSVWYYLAYQQDGKRFLDIAFAENIGRFLGMKREQLGIDYNLGHDGPFWYYIPAILAGFLPWSLVLVFAAFTFSYKKCWKNTKISGSSFFKGITEMDKLTLFSSLVVILFICFYAIPSSKRSVYILPVYPFAAYLLTKVFLWVEVKKPIIFRIMGKIIGAFAGLLLTLSCVAHFINLSGITTLIPLDAKTTNDVSLFADFFMNPGWLGYLLWSFLLVVFVLFIGWLRTRNARTILFGTFTLFISIQICLEGTFYPVFKNGNSLQPIAREFSASYDIKGKTYVINNLKYYSSIYGLNFYMDNDFKNFEVFLPSDGYLIIANKNISRLREKYTGKYDFVVLRQSKKTYNEFNDKILLCKIVKI